MPHPSVRIPTYRLHKPSGRAVVTIDGRDIYLGKHGTPESKAEYNRVIGQWQLGGRPTARPAPSAEATVDELIAPYLEFARSYYIKNGRATSSQEGVRRALRHLHERYGAVPASQFGPLMLKALRQTMIDRGTWSRTTINQAVEVIKRMFKWAAEHELVDADAYHRLRTLSGLRKGRSPARESRPVKPVPEDHIDKTLRCSPAPVAAMIQLQRYTGMRPEEVVIMRLRDLDQSGKAWIYTPSSHKTEHHGRQRRIFLGPKAQCVLMPYLAIAPEQYLFRPTEAEARMRAQRRARRTTPLSCGNRAGTNRKRAPARTPGQRYTTDSYRRAIARACEQAFPPPKHLARIRAKAVKGTRWETNDEWRDRLGQAGWNELSAWRKRHHWSPNQLRHNAATELRKQFGIEAARVVLGHSSAVVTEIYAEMDFAKAEQIMAEAG